MNYWMEKLKGLMAGQSAGPKDTTMMSGHYMPQGMGGAMAPQMQEMSPDDMLMDPSMNSMEGMGPAELMGPPVPTLSDMAAGSDTLPNDPSTLTVEAKAKLEKPVMKPDMIKSLEDIKAMVKADEAGDGSIEYTPTNEDPRVTERMNRSATMRLEAGLKKTPQEINDYINGANRPKKPTLQDRYNRR